MAEGTELAEELPPPPPPPPLARPGVRSALSTPLGVGAAALVGCAYISLVDPNTTQTFGICPFRAVTGWDCPGCGATRAVRALLGGDVMRALDHNVLWTALIPVLVYGWVVWVAGRVGHRLPWPRDLFQRTWWIWPTIGVLVAFWIMRNVGGPEGWMASGA